MNEPSNKTEPALDYVTVTPSSSDLADGVCRAILCTEDGFLNLTTESGQMREDVPVFKGYNPLTARAIDDPTTGSAPGVVVALY
jgi:hypothetical protein